MVANKFSEQIDQQWKELLRIYPDGVSNTSTTKYIEIRRILSEMLKVPTEEIYATGAKTRTSNLDTRFVQGNQAGRHTKVGVAFLQTDGDNIDVEKLSTQAVTTSTKFVDGSDKTSYDAVLIFVETSGSLQLTRVIESNDKPYFDLVKTIYPGAKKIAVDFVQQGTTKYIPAATNPAISSNLLPDIVHAFHLSSEKAGLQLTESFICRFIAALLTKRFLILSGLSGSGKTKIAQGFARWISKNQNLKDRSGKNNDQNFNPFYRVVPVGADWTGSESIIGYPDGLDTSSYVVRPALELIVHAVRTPNVPHFLILDEMNLSHVERYFSDFLSLIESDEFLCLYCDKKDSEGRIINTRGIDPILRLPKNLFVIGTVNVDETTYMFSPKVLDRANVIEFRVTASDLSGFLQKIAKPDLSELDGAGESFGQALTDGADGTLAIPENLATSFRKEILFIFEVLKNNGLEFGFRTAYESSRFIRFYQITGNHPDALLADWFPKAFDCVIIQKILPKLHGSRSKLGPTLKSLWYVCMNPISGRTDASVAEAIAAARSSDKSSEPSLLTAKDSQYPLTAEKIGRMWQLLLDNGFASFAEA